MLAVRFRTVFYLALVGVGAYAGWLGYNRLTDIPIWEGEMVMVPLLGEVEVVALVFPVAGALLAPSLFVALKDVLTSP